MICAPLKYLFVKKRRRRRERRVSATNH